MRKLKRLGCALLAALCLLGGALAESVETEPAPAPVEQKQPAQEAPAKATEPRDDTTSSGGESSSNSSANGPSDAGADASPNQGGDPSPAGESTGPSGDSSESTQGDSGENNPDAPSDTSPDTSAGGDGEATDTGTDDPTTPPAGDPVGNPDPEDPGAPGDDPAENPDEPGVGGISIHAEPSEGVVQQDGAFLLPTDRAATLRLTWSDAGAQAYRINLSSAQGSVHSGTQSESAYVADLSALQAGRYTFTVEAIVDGAVTARGTYGFTLSTGDDVPGGEPGGRGGGGGFHGGGSRSGSRSGGKSGDEPAEEGEDGETSPRQALNITPGVALASTHTSGTKDTLLYGTVELRVSGDPMRQLVVGDAFLDVLLDDGQRSFTAEIDGERLTLSAKAGERWRVNGQALRQLAASGIETLVLQTDTHTEALSTTQALSGHVYAGLRAEGRVSSDFDYTVSADGIRVSVGGVDYRLGSAGELIPMEGDGHVETMDDPAAGAA